ncbi:hypothetical protein WDW37_15785 [Bdellovibrionota bacterium FG-1]
MKHVLLLIMATLTASQSVWAGNAERNGTGGLVGPVTIPYLTKCSSAAASKGDCTPDLLASWRIAFNNAKPLKIGALPKKTFCLQSSDGLHVDTGRHDAYALVCFGLDGLVPLAGHVTTGTFDYTMEGRQSNLAGAVALSNLNALEQINGEWTSYWAENDFKRSNYTHGYLPLSASYYEWVYGTFKLTYRQSGSSLIIKVELCPVPDNDMPSGEKNGWQASGESQDGYYERGYILVDLIKDRLK